MYVRNLCIPIKLTQRHKTPLLITTYL